MYKMSKLNLTSIHVPTWQADHDAYVAKLKADHLRKEAVKRNAIYLACLGMIYAGIAVFTGL